MFYRTPILWVLIGAMKVGWEQGFFRKMCMGNTKFYKGK